MPDNAHFIDDGEQVKITLAATVAKGDVVALGTTGIGIAASDGVSGDTIAVIRRGKFRLAKQASLAVGQDALLYWDDTAKELDTTGTNIPAGRAAQAALAADTTVDVLLNE